MKNKEIIQFLEWLTKEDSKYAIMYGNQKERFADNNKEYTIEEILEIYHNERISYI